MKPKNKGSLPCRNEQYKKLYSLVCDGIEQKVGGCIYVYGVPGTGKTATVSIVIDTIASSKKYRFRYANISGLKLVDPYQVYVEIYKQLYDKILSPSKAEKYLDHIFTKPSDDDYTVLVIDELDSLNTKKYDIIYQLFSWPEKYNSKLLLIAISNTFNLGEQLSKRVASRVGYARIAFQPYKHLELVKILKFHYDSVDFASDALGFIGRKVEAISGDARRALYICRRAIEISEEKCVNMKGKRKKSKQVNMSDVTDAIDELQSSSRVEIMKQISEQQMTFLKSIIRHFRVSGKEEGSFNEIYPIYVDFCNESNFGDPTMSNVLQVAQSLQSIRLVLIEPGKTDGEKRVKLNVFQDEIEYAIEKRKTQTF